MHITFEDILQVLKNDLAVEVREDFEILTEPVEKPLMGI